jgi:hypothetical protein
MEMKNKKLGRRKFIKLASASGALIAADPVLKLFVGSIFDGYMSDAKAQGIAPRNLVYFSIYGGATPWYFNNPLTPNASDVSLFVPCKQVSTRINGSGQDQLGNRVYNVEYATTAVTKNSKTLNMPHMFSWPIPKAGGGDRPTTDICDNMLMIRGIKMFDDSHDLNSRLMHGPVAGSPSISGIGADSALSNIPCISIGKFPFYKSENGIGVTEIDTGISNYMSNVMASFNTYANQSFRQTASLKDKIYAALDFLKGYRGGENSPLNGLVDSRERAEAIIVAGIGDLVQEYEDAKSKYEDLNLRSIRNTNLPGLTDQALPGCQFPITVEGDVQFEGKTYESNYRQATCQFQHYHYYLTGSDMRNNFNGARTSDLEKQFALAEVLLKHQLCGNINIALGTLGNVSTNTGSNLTRQYDPASNTTTFDVGSSGNDNWYMGFDNHSGGYIHSLLGYTLFYRAFSSCLAELQDQLRATTYAGGANAWNESLVVLYSEMGRKPDDRGTEHYGNGNAISMWGGVLSFDCLGDIYDKGFHPNHTQFPGTYGSGKEMVSDDQNLNGRRILNENIASTICNILRYPRTPAPNNNSLVFVDEVNGVASYQIATGRTFARGI